MTNIENALASELPNLDGIVLPSEAAAMRKHFKELSQTFKQLASYCEGKEMAMQCRLDGKIEQARRFEAAIDDVYKQLPEWARW